MMQPLPRDFSSIDRKARIKIESRGLPFRPVAQRIRDFDEVIAPLDEDWAVHEASRCIHCPDPPPCQRACPVGNDISYAMWLIENRRFLEAAQVYRQTSNLPAICGRVCPHEQFCQMACPLGKRGAPVLTGALEAFVADYERNTHPAEIFPGTPSGKQVAVVGAGPAGLSAAEELVKYGHCVTIFDAKPAPGGLLVYGIPNFKLPKSIVWSKWETLAKAGVQFVGDTYIGRDKTIDDLFDEGFEAVFLGVGTSIDARMGKTPGTDLTGVYQATDFLERGNVNPDALPSDKREPLKIGSRVVVVGGGDTASDCLRTALRLGAKNVTCLYRRSEKEMPGCEKDRQLAQEEGAKYRFLVQPVRFIPGADGQLIAVECVQTRLGEPDGSGRRRPIPVEGSNFSIPADTAILALGYWPDPIIGETTPDLETHKWGLIKVIDPESGATTRPGIFAGGDCVTGPDVVATAMVSGRKAAAAIDEYLSGS